MKHLPVVISACITLLVVPISGASQTIQLGVAAGLGMGGPAIEADAATKRFGFFGRLHVSLDGTSASMLGTRVYLVGERNAAFYVSGAWTQLKCPRVTLGGTGTSCDGNPHTGWALLGGAELGSPKGLWSIYVDAGPYFFARDVPGLRDWTFVGGVRFRPSMLE